MSSTQPDIQTILDSLSQGYFSNLVESHHFIDAKEPKYCPFPAEMRSELDLALKRMRINRLYSHQKAALDLIFEGKDVLITSGTASGKSLCYQLPIAQAQLENQKSTAILLFPTKALAADQLKKLIQLFQNTEPLSALISGITKYDGDTSPQERNTIRKRAKILFSNPDMLHISILPHHSHWEDFFNNINFVVIDEVHTYRGVFGSHFANLLRRLNRILTFYGSKPQYILTSATISNAKTFCEKLTERDIIEVKDDGSGHGKKNFYFINPPVIDAELGLRKGMIAQCGDLVQNWISENVQILLFARSRKTVEITLRRLLEQNNHQPYRIHGYRSGYLPAERRQIESGLKNGEVQSVVATNALELGVDMGKVDVVIMMGYPGTISSFFQQSGRAGRRNKPSVAVLVASPSPIDQFIVKSSDFIFSKNFEQAMIDPDNPLILISHLQCAAYELPFKKGDSFGSLNWTFIEAFLSILVNTKQLFAQNGHYYWRNKDYPASHISLRNIAESPIQLLLTTDQKKSIGEIDFSSARRFVYPGAIYLHNGLAYRVVTLDLDDHQAIMESFEGNYFTDPQLDVKIEYSENFQKRNNGGLSFYFGEMEVREIFRGYRKLDWETARLIDVTSFDLPDSILLTKGFWMNIPETIIASLRKNNLWINDPIDYGRNWQAIRSEVLHRDRFRCQVCGFESSENSLHVHHIIPFRTFSDFKMANNPDNLITLCPKCHINAEQNLRIRSGLSGFAYLFASIAPLFVMCDAQDIGYTSETLLQQSGGGASVTVYDQHPGGIGLSAMIFQLAEDIIKQCKAIIDTCECSNGCPSCVGPSGENDLKGKEYALALIHEISKRISSNE